VWACSEPRFHPHPPLAKPLNPNFPKASEFPGQSRAPRSLRQSCQPGVLATRWGAFGCEPAARPPFPASSDLLPLPLLPGKHEERQDDHGYISRCFTRKYP